MLTLRYVLMLLRAPYAQHVYMFFKGNAYYVHVAVIRVSHYDGVIRFTVRINISVCSFTLVLPRLLSFFDFVNMIRVYEVYVV
jgi:hypothetical protein